MKNYPGLLLSTKHRIQKVFHDQIVDVFTRFTLGYTMQSSKYLECVIFNHSFSMLKVQLLLSQQVDILSFNLHDHQSLCSLTAFHSFVIPCKNKNQKCKNSIPLKFIPCPPHKNKEKGRIISSVSVRHKFSDLPKDICLWQEVEGHCLICLLHRKQLYVRKNKSCFLIVQHSISLDSLPEAPR